MDNPEYEYCEHYDEPAVYKCWWCSGLGAYPDCSVEKEWQDDFSTFEEFSAWLDRNETNKPEDSEE